MRIPSSADFAPSSTTLSRWLLVFIRPILYGRYDAGFPAEDRLDFRAFACMEANLSFDGKPAF